MKKCSKCGKEKELEEFDKQKGGKYGLRAPCRICEIKRRKIYRFKYPEKNLLNNIKSKAKKFGIPFNLELEDIFIPKVCPVFKKPFVYNKGLQDFSVSLDRINSNKGYVKGNILVISVKANRIKSNATPKEIQIVATFFKQFKKEI